MYNNKNNNNNVKCVEKVFFNINFIFQSCNIILNFETVAELLNSNDYSVQRY